MYQIKISDARQFHNLIYTVIDFCRFGSHKWLNIVTDSFNGVVVLLLLLVLLLIGRFHGRFIYAGMPIISRFPSNCTTNNFRLIHIPHAPHGQTELICFSILYLIVSADNLDSLQIRLGFVCLCVCVCVCVCVLVFCRFVFGWLCSWATKHLAFLPIHRNYLYFATILTARSTHACP